MASFEVGQWHRYKSLISDGNSQSHPTDHKVGEAKPSQNQTNSDQIENKTNFQTETEGASKARKALSVARTYRPPSNGLFRHGTHRRNFS